jgi:hypothetical protein
MPRRVLSDASHLASPHLLWLLRWQQVQRARSILFGVIEARLAYEMIVSLAIPGAGWLLLMSLSGSITVKHLGDAAE